MRDAARLVALVLVLDQPEVEILVAQLTALRRVTLRNVVKFLPDKSSCRVRSAKVGCGIKKDRAAKLPLALLTPCQWAINFILI